MKLSTWIEEYKNTTDDLKAKKVKGIIKRKYVPVKEKIYICKLMAEKSLSTDPVSYISYIDMAINKLNIYGIIIALYTDLEYDKDKDGKPMTAECYDMLTETGVIKEIINNIGEDIIELMKINESALSSLERKECTTEALIGRLFGSFETIINNIATSPELIKMIQSRKIK